MDALLNKIITTAGSVGAPLIKGVIQNSLGGGIAGTLAGSLIDTIAQKAGVSVAGITHVDDEELQKAIIATESEAPEMIALWSRGIDMQQSMFDGESQAGFWHSFWRSGWMYLLGIFWIWRIIFVPLFTHFSGSEIASIDYDVLLTLTGWFMALYMGGHTVKELGKNVSDALINRGKR